MINEGTGQRACALGRHLVYLASVSTPEEHCRIPSHPGTESGDTMLGTPSSETTNRRHLQDWCPGCFWDKEHTLADAFCPSLVLAFPAELLASRECEKLLSTSLPTELRLGLALSLWMVSAENGGQRRLVSETAPGHTQFEDGPPLAGKAGTEQSAWVSLSVGRHRASHRPCSPTCWSCC